MSIDFSLLGEQGVLLAGLVLGLLLLKTVILWSLCRLMRVDAADATRVSLLLSQSGEFGFVIFGLAAFSGILPLQLFQFLTMVVALTMVTTPMMANLGEYLNRRLFKTTARHDVSTSHIDAGQPHVIIAGFGRVGQHIASVLQGGNVPYVAIDSNPERVLEGRRDGFSVFYGDASHVDVLKAAGADQAAILVCTLDEAVPAIRLVSIMRQHYPDIAIHTRGHNRQHCNQLLAAGATIAISETLEASFQIGAAVLNAMGQPEEEIDELIDGLRKEEYR
jgi:voltage-gated potassium channel Kch